MNARERIKAVANLYYDAGDQGTARKFGQALDAEDALIVDLEALVEAAKLVMHDRDASDDESKPVDALRDALAKFMDEEANR